MLHFWNSNWGLGISSHDYLDLACGQVSLCVHHDVLVALQCFIHLFQVAVQRLTRAPFSLNARIESCWLRRPPKAGFWAMPLAFTEPWSSNFKAIYMNISEVASTKHSDHFQYTVIRSMADINQNDLLFPFGTLGLARRLGLFRFNFNLLFLFLTGRFNHSWICSILVLPIFQRHWTSFGTSRFSFCCRRFLRLHCPGVKSKTCFFHNMRLEP